MNAVLPTISHNQRNFKPGFYATLGVAVAMGLFAFITIGNLNIFRGQIDGHIFEYATLGIAVIFALRAIGDFRYIGFFKKATGTLFARNDTRYYSPLCIMIAVLSLIIALLN